ncbi:hypothetical protein K501DRAFT_332936 [Backusella circina FSU 941]|nr:hypothetical protein K501DRAFT_332936 [Backusella circina FSU 941]
MNSSTSTSNNKEPLRLLLDQRRIYMNDSLGSVMMRGEVIVNFPKDTMILGPIQLVFEGIQRFYTWSGIVDTMPEGEMLETKLQVIELSVLPPNSNGIMPAGIQRFPFEFPIPANLPTSMAIKDRMEIFYQIRASLTKSSQTTPEQRSSWLARVRHTGANKKLIACTSIRITRTLESVSIRSVNNEPTDEDNTATPSPTASTLVNEEDNATSAVSVSPRSTFYNALSDTPFPWDRRNLNEYQASLDEQIDQLAFSLAGRSADNFNASEGALGRAQGIRYKIGIDRTAVVLGTSIGLELMIEPTVSDVRILSTHLDIVESREYTMKLPKGDSTERKQFKEGVKMILKWAYGYPIETTEEVLESEKNLHKKKGKLTDHSDRYVHLRPDNREHLSYFDAMSPGVQTQKASVSFDQDKPALASPDIKKVLEAEDKSGQTSVSEGSLYAPINLKTLDQTVKVGEYFGGRFVVPVPDCYSIMNPSMTHDSIKISHWIKFVITVACHGEIFDITLDSPMHMLDCRLVTFGDETILPPPPSYDPTTSSCLDLSWSGTFWEQRERIASQIGFGACYPCPCELRKSNNTRLPIYAKETPQSFMKKSTIIPQTPFITAPSLAPEWGPPPSYSQE